MPSIAKFKATRTPDDLRAFFNELATAPSVERADVIDTIEKEILPQFQHNITFAQSPKAQEIISQYNEVKEFKNMGSFEEAASKIKNTLQMIEITLLEIQKEKKNGADPFVSAFLLETTKMSEEDRKTFIGWHSTIQKIKLPKI
jgi:esterase/lipase